MERFDAFISYSHAVDGKLAPALQDGLQRFARRMFQRRALRVFRDQTGLSTNPHLWGSIEEALDASSWFVLLASPESAGSPWVDREVTTWLERKPADHLLIVVTAGELVFHDIGGVDAERTDCLPATLVRALDREPRWLDLRWARDDAQLDLRNGRFRAGIADIAAPIHGVAKDDLESEDVRHQKRAKGLAIIAITTVAALAIASTTAAVIALDQRREAAAQREEAVSQRDRADDSANRATARGLAAQAAALAPTTIDTSLLLAVEGYRREASLDTETGLLTALDNARLITRLSTGLPADVADLATSPDRATLYVLTRSGDIRQYDSSTLIQVGEPLATGIDEPLGLTRSGDGSRLAFGSGGGAGVIDLATGTLVASGLGGTTASVALNGDGSRIAVALEEEPAVQMFDVGSSKKLYDIEASIGIPLFLSDERLAVQELGSNSLSVYKVGDAAATLDTTKELAVSGGGLLASPDGSLLLAGGLDGDAVLLDANTLEQRGPVVRSRGSRTGGFFFSPDGTRAGLSGDDGSALVIDTENAREVATLSGLTGSLATEFTGDTSLVSASVTNDSAAAWSIAGRSAIGTGERAAEEVDFLRTLDDAGTVVASEGSTLVEAPFDQIASPPVVRTFETDGAETFIRALDVNEDAGLAAVVMLDFDSGTGDVVGEQLHIIDLANLSDSVVVDLGERWLENVSLSPDGRLLAAGLRDGRLMIVDVATGDVVVDPIDVDEWPCCLGTLVWSADGKRLHTGGQDGVLRTFDTATWKVLGEHPLSPGSALRLSQLTPDGTTIIVPSESGEVFFVDATTGEPIGEPFEAGGTQLQRAALVSGGTTLAAQGRDGKLRLWDVATRRAIGPPLSAHVYSQSIEPIGDDVVVSGGAEGYVIRWDLDPQSWVDRACELAGRNLTRDQWERYIGGDYRPTCEQWPVGS